MSEETEQQRLRALRRFNLLDTPAEPAFDEIAQAAAVIMGTPISAVSFVDAERQWFKARVGLGVSETPRSVSFCAHAMLGRELFVVPDATLHPAFSGNALVTGEPHIRFYAGAPIRMPDGKPLGALCVIDTTPRPEGVNPQQAELLRILASQVENQIRLRLLMRDQNVFAAGQARTIAKSVEREDQLVNAFDMADIGWWDWDVKADRVVASPAMAEAFGVEPEAAALGVSINDFIAAIHPDDRLFVKEGIDEALQTGAAYREDYRVGSSAGGYVWVSARGRCELDLNGQPSQFAGVVIDITERKAAEARLRDADLGRELAMQAAALGRFDHNPSKGERFYDKRALEMIGLNQAQVQSLEGVINSVVHPDDRAPLAKALADAIDPKRTGPLRHTYRIIHAQTGQEHWLTVVGRSQFVNGECVRFMGVFEDVTLEKVAENHRRLLTNELNHRVKNSLTVVASIVDQSLRQATDPRAARQEITGRIQALGQAHDILTANSWEGAPIPKVVDDVLGGLSAAKGRIEISGGPVILGPAPALQLALALHELATNAIKYGALSNDTGRVRLTWTLEGVGAAATLVMIWEERGGPTVRPPMRQGFGSRLLQRATAGAFNGDVEMEYLPKGIRWRLWAPLPGLAESGRITES